mgnify:CR=1 FL=1
MWTWGSGTELVLCCAEQTGISRILKKGKYSNIGVGSYHDSRDHFWSNKPWCAWGNVETISSEELLSYLLPVEGIKEEEEKTWILYRVL